MEAFLTQLVGNQAYAFLMIFARIGTALMLMPGIGDSFVPERIRLAFCLSFAVILTPFLSPLLPHVAVGSAEFVRILFFEMLVGFFIGTITRVLMTALDTAGMVISTQTGLAAAQIFNPAFSSQGSIFGGFLSMTGVLLVLSTNMHHMLLTGLVDTYSLFPPGHVDLDMETVAMSVARTVNEAFKIGFSMSIPFILVMMVVSVCMGALSRLMPQLQIFTLIVPVQILAGFAMLAITFGAALMYWLDGFNGILLNIFGR